MLALSLFATAKEQHPHHKQARAHEERRLLTGVTLLGYNSNEAQQSPATVTLGGTTGTSGAIATSLAYRSGEKATGKEVVGATTCTTTTPALGACPAVLASSISGINPATDNFIGYAMVNPTGGNANSCDDYDTLVLGNAAPATGKCAVFVSNGGHALADDVAPTIPVKTVVLHARTCLLLLLPSSSPSSLPSSSPLLAVLQGVGRHCHQLRFGDRVHRPCR